MTHLDEKHFISDKVTIIGAGYVGATTAFALMNGGVTSEIAIIDLNEKKLSGEVLDLNHGISFVPQVYIHEGTYDDCEDSNIVIITAGVGQKPGESRIDLLKRNIEVFRHIIPRVVERNRNCVILVVTNPVDILTYAALKISGLPDNQVIGSGTVLDSARFKYLLSRHCRVAPHNVNAYIIGEHGDTEVPAWSITNIAGMQVERFCFQCGRECDQAEKNRIFEEVKNSAYQIIDGKGATYYAVALAVRRIVEAILRKENAVLPVSSLMKGYYGVEDVCLSLPSIVNDQGLDRVLQLPLNEQEINGFRHSANTLKKALREIGF
ncbi:MAG: L-lactate dehydrogenase [Caldicoprobacterales bacterium]|jgi:L-lactate dehydrogenase|nr:L-lactate dehydrogenase [Clostridiales bacterium]